MGEQQLPLSNDYKRQDQYIMKVLLVSHNVISTSTNMGKTLRAFFDNWAPDEIAQLYVHSEVPTDDTVCRNYYRITDMEVVKSVILPGKYGTHFGPEDIERGRANPRTDTGLQGQIYQKSRSRTALVYTVRDLYWRMGHWYTKALRQWIREFSPDVIFLASGDYSFIYRVASRIAEDFNLPMVAACFDDYYLHNRNEGSLLGRIRNKEYMNTVRKTMARTESIITVSEPMIDEYTKLFGKPCRVLYTSCNAKQIDFAPDADRIAYFGNLDFQRDKQLIDIGRALKQCTAQGKPAALDVYSAEKNPEILKNLNEENGICFHGAVAPDQIPGLMVQCLAVIHTESFDPEMVQQVRFSVSTKIAESVTVGPCLFAYGPAQVASMDYLIRNDAAYVVTRPEDLAASLEDLICNREKRGQILVNARNAAARNHSAQVNTQNMKKWLTEAIQAFSERD